MSAIPDNDEALLTAGQTSAALTEAGFPVAEATLDTKVTRGGGPPYQKFGNTRLYRWGPTLKWAQGRLSKLVRTAAEHRRAATELRSRPLSNTTRTGTCAGRGTQGWHPVENAILLAPARKYRKPRARPTKGPAHD
jgi:hypothetical protein